MISNIPICISVYFTLFLFVNLIPSRYSTYDSITISNTSSPKRRFYSTLLVPNLWYKLRSICQLIFSLITLKMIRYPKKERIRYKELGEFDHYHIPMPGFVFNNFRFTDI